MYYIQHTHKYLGDSVVWWRPNSAGYTVDLDEAGEYTEEKARGIEQLRGEEKAVPVAVAKAAASLHVKGGRLREVMDAHGEQPREAEPQHRATRYTYIVWDRGEWGREEIHIEARRQDDGSELWAITNDGYCWHKAGSFVHEALPSSRDDEWLRLVRFTLEQAKVEVRRAIALKLRSASARLEAHDRVDE